MITIDVHEPECMESYIKQSIPIKIEPLNAHDLCDYLFYAVDKHSITFERKKASQLLGDVDGTESRLKLGLANADEVALIVEGMIAPSMLGSASYSLSRDGRFMFKDREFALPYSMVAAFLYRIDKSGIWVLYTADEFCTAQALVACYNNAQNLEHTTFRRYVRQKPELWIPDPYMETLMGMSKSCVRIGEETASRLLREFGTPWYVYNRSITELQIVEGVGPKTAKGIYKAIGKEE